MCKQVTYRIKINKKPKRQEAEGEENDSRIKGKLHPSEN